jgi:DNA-binding transcriptional MerR regulator
MLSNTLTLDQMCETYGITRRTVRYYESLGLIQSEKATRQRHYDAKAQARMTLILRGRRFGIALEAIRQWLDIYHRKGTVPQLEAWLVMADQQLDQLQVKKADLAIIIAELRQSRDDTLTQIAHTNDKHLIQECQQ